MKKLIFVLLTCFATSAFAFPTGPVMISSNDDLDACGGYGIATATTTLFSFNEKTGYVEFNVVNASQGVYFCDHVSDVDGEYYGIVFSEDGANVNCGINEIDRKEPEAYKGPCKSGWVKADFLLLIAG